MNPLSILLTLLILSVLVVVHEFGHFIAARKVGVAVEEFSIGMGPALYKRQGKETLFAIRILLIGGYCKLRGEADASEEQKIDPNDTTNFLNKSKKERLFILVAGVMMNFIFGYLCILIALFLNGNGLKAFGQAFIVSGNFGVAIIDSLRMMVIGEVGLDQVAGPIGMVTMVNDFVQQGILTMLSFTALISINLGILNLLPLPALDGGQILIIIIEKIIRRDIPREKTGLINFIGFALLMLFAIIVAFHDILRLAA